MIYRSKLLILLVNAFALDYIDGFCWLPDVFRKFVRDKRTFEHYNPWKTNCIVLQSSEREIDAEGPIYISQFMKNDTRSNKLEGTSRDDLASLYPRSLIASPVDRDIPKEFSYSNLRVVFYIMLATEVVLSFVDC